MKEIDKVIDFIRDDRVLDIVEFHENVFYKLSRGYCAESPCWMNSEMDISYTSDPTTEQNWTCIFIEDEKDQLSVVLSQYKNRKFIEDKYVEREKFLHRIYGR